MSVRTRLTTLLCGLISLIFLLTAVLASFAPVTFRTDHDWLSPLVILLATGVYLGGMGLIFRWFHRLPAQAHRPLNGILWGILLLIQIIVAVNWVAAPRADLYFVHQQALDLVAGSRHWVPYFSTYPNNVSFTILLSALLKLGRWVVGPHHLGLWLNLAQFIWLDCGLWLAWRELNRKNPARGQLFLSILIGTVPLYAYALNTYSDTFVLPAGLITIVLVRHLLKARTWRQILPNTVGLGLILTVAYLLKANFIVLIIAVVLVIWLLPLTAVHPLLMRSGVTILIVGLLAGGIGLSHQTQRAFGYQPNTSQALPTTSWIAMSWNPANHGEYNRHDATQIIRQPSAAAKKARAESNLRHYLHEMGPSGILLHLYRKARLFLATGTFDSFQISPAYDHAPTWYRQHRNTTDWLLANWCQINYLALLIVNCGWGLQQIRRRKIHTGYLLGGLFILGLACFHIIFWETEERYALPLLPLLIAGTAAGYRQPLNLLRWSQRTRWLPLGLAAGFTLALGLGAWQNAALFTQPQNHPISVVSQNEGRYYQNHRLRLTAQQSLTQPFTAPLPFDQLVINNGKAFTGQLVLRNRAGQRVWQSHGRQISLTQTIPLMPAGHYSLSITATGPQAQPLVTAPATYPLLSQALVGHPHQYLRFFVNQHSAGPILSPTKLWLIIGAIWLGGLLIIDRFYWYRQQI